MKTASSLPDPWKANCIKHAHMNIKYIISPFFISPLQLHFSSACYVISSRPVSPAQTSTMARQRLWLWRAADGHWAAMSLGPTHPGVHPCGCTPQAAPQQARHSLKGRARGLCTGRKTTELCFGACPLIHLKPPHFREIHLNSMSKTIT